MMNSRNHSTDPAVLSLDAAASQARSGFACMFSNSQDYETALIVQRRAQGRYGAPRTRMPRAALIMGAATITVMAVCFV